MKIRVLAMIVVAVASAVGGVEILWAGLTLERAPSFEQEFERLLREDLLVSGDITMVDREAALQLSRKVDFDEFAAVSKRLVERVMNYIPDSTIIVWGRVTDYTVQPKRCGFLGMFARVEGNLTMAINIYSLRFQKYAFAGDISCTSVVPKGAIFFYPLSVAVHISSEDRAQLASALQRDAAKKCATMVLSVIRSEVKKQERMRETAGAKKYEDASIAEIFRIPSVEGTIAGKKPDTDTAAPDAAKAVTPRKPGASAGKPAPGPRAVFHPTPSDSAASPAPATGPDTAGPNDSAAPPAAP